MLLTDLQALAWALIDLGQHREYIELLREEISRAEEESHYDITGNLPLMECFLRESSRLHPLDGRRYPHLWSPNQRLTP